MGRHHAVRVTTITVLLVAAGGWNGGSLDARSHGAGEPLLDSVSAAVGEPVREPLRLAAPSLDGNLLGDPSEVAVVVETPATYATEPARRYPVVYFLAGFDEGPSVASISGALEELIAAGEAPEMILVAVSGDNALGGSFYVDSPVTGAWARAVVDDVVGAIDERYRTLATPASRGIAGFSMGGYGALALAMAHPDVFGAVYALSPGLFAPGGLAQSQMFDDPAVISDFVAAQAELASMPPADSGAELVRVMGRGADVRFSAAYGVAFAPDPSGRPPWIQYPFTDPAGPPDPDVWARWEAGFGGIAAGVDAAREELVRLRGIVIDVGLHDEYAWIPPGCEYLHEVLDRAGIPNRLERYEGGHGPVGPRAREVMLPFFAAVLDTT